MSDPQQAIYFFDMLKRKWLKDMGPTEDYFLVISNGPNFRHTLYPDYKANRKDIKRHPAFNGLRDWAKELNGVIWEDGIEADDLIGIKVTEEEHRVAVSADKDFATIPCKLFIPASHGKEGSWHEFTEAQADRNWLIQTMTGDTVDNYKGIPGVGPVKAKAFLPAEESLENMWHRVKTAFVQHKQTEEYALTMARLARILRHGEYSFDTKEVTLWEPQKKIETASTVTTANYQLTITPAMSASLGLVTFGNPTGPQKYLPQPPTSPDQDKL